MQAVKGGEMYPSTQNTGTLTSLISAIGKHGLPAKFTTKDLPIWGYKSSHDRSVVGVLKFIGFIDTAGTPTDLWKEARTDAALAVARGVRKAYSQLFSVFPDAERKDSETLTNFFKAKTTASEANAKKMMATFKALGSFGDFDRLDDRAAGTDTVSPKLDEVGGPVSMQDIKVLGDTGSRPAVVINLQMSLPADPSGEIYDKFFAAMKKHIYDDQ